MKKYSLFLILCIVCIFTMGCSKTPTPEVSMSDGNGIDIDLTVVSRTMAYAEVYDIMKNSEDYVGKIIKIAGRCVSSNQDSELGFHYIIVEDETACCVESLEFIWIGERIYPDDDTIIEVVGKFESYENLGDIYYRLAVENITIL